MAFTVDDFQDLLKLLEEHPEWQAQLRPVVLGKEILEIPSRMDRVEAALERVAERLDALTERMDAFEARMAAFDAHMEAVTAAQQENARQMGQLIERMDKMDGRMGNIEGGFLEMRYQRYIPLWFAEWLRRPAEAGDEEFDQLHAARESGAITAKDSEAIRNLDLLIRGYDRSEPEQPLTLLAVEASQTVNVDDVTRASERAEILRRAGFRARGFVGGYRITEEARRMAEERHLIVSLHRPD